MTIRLGYQIPRFTYPGGRAADIAPTVIAQAREAEGAGFDTVLVMDHFYQLPGIGEPDEPMLEAYTLLGALATATEKVQLSTLVTGNTYRNPTLLGKAVTTLDVVSGGRAVLGIGAGWYELEHQQLASSSAPSPTGSNAWRRRWGSSRRCCAASARRSPGVGTARSPRTTSRGCATTCRSCSAGAGSGEPFRLAARYADHLNIICNAVDLPRKLDALAQRCADEGRDRSTLETSYLAFVMVDEDGDGARRMQRDFLRYRGVDLDALDDDARALATDRHFVGTPDDVAEQLRTRVLEPGVDGIILNLVANGHVPGAVDLVGRTLAPLVSYPR